MKFNVFFALVFTLFATSNSFSQVYEHIYANSGPEVQNQIDNNKIAGVDILQGIYSKHVIGLSGIGVSNITELKTELLKNTDVIHVEVSEDGTILQLMTKAVFTKDVFNTFIVTFNCIVTGYSIQYSI